MDFIRKHGEGTKLFVFETSTPSLYSDVKFIEQVKKEYPDAVTLLVGTHPSALPEETLGLSTSIDAICRHEFDYIVRDVAKSIRDGKDYKSVLGLTYRDADGKIKSNPDMPYIEDLDEIPFASRFIKEYLNYKDYFFGASLKSRSLPAVAVWLTATSACIPRLCTAINIACVLRRTWWMNSSILPITSLT